ncbi:hypothetical protein MTP99_002992 [Tenebrio molitor]|nr:hypothetical protein MTP99_002992 [Tenebrio molitor]
MLYSKHREARDATRRKLQALPEKRTSSAAALSEKEYKKIVQVFDEESPEGLQKKFFLIASYELAWRGGAKRLTESKWLIPNENAELCPVRLYHKLLSKRGNNVKTERMFLTPNPFWNSNGKNYWYYWKGIGIEKRPTERLGKVASLLKCSAKPDT